MIASFNPRVKKESLQIMGHSLEKKTDKKKQVKMLNRDVYAPM